MLCVSAVYCLGTQFIATLFGTAYPFFLLVRPAPSGLKPPATQNCEEFLTTSSMNHRNRRDNFAVASFGCSPGGIAGLCSQKLQDFLPLRDRNQVKEYLL